MPFSLPRAVHLACGPLAFVAALLSLTVCFAAQPSRLPHVAARLAAHQPLRIVALGSSSTEGVGASAPDRTYPAVLQALLARDLPEQVAVLNHGIGGEDVDDMMRRLPGVIAERPDLVIWQTGSNDALRGVPIDRFEAETRAGIVQLRDAGIDVMLMEPQLSQRLADTPGSAVYLEAVRSLGQALGVPVLRRYDLMRQWLAAGALTDTSMMSGDGLHMGDGGYRKLAEAVEQAILQAAGATPPPIATR